MMTKKRYCDNSLSRQELVRPSYLSDKSNVFKCSCCDKKVFVKRKEMSAFEGGMT